MGVAPFVLICFLRMWFFVMGTVPDPQNHYNINYGICQYQTHKKLKHALFEVCSLQFIVYSL